MKRESNNLLPFKALLFGSFALYLYQAHKRGKAMGSDDGTRFTVDRDKIIHSMMPWVTTNPMIAPIVANAMEGLINSVLGSRRLK